MEELPGSLGTSASFSLRLGQTIFASASLLIMSLGINFYSYTSFCYLVTIMGLVIPWSFTLALLDGYSVIAGCPLRRAGIVLVIAMGDWVLSILSLAAACSAASVVEILSQLGEPFCPSKECNRFQLSVAMTFLSWFLTTASFLFNLWRLPSL